MPGGCAPSRVGWPTLRAGSRPQRQCTGSLSDQRGWRGSNSGSSGGRPASQLTSKAITPRRGDPYSRGGPSDAMNALDTRVAPRAASSGRTCGDPRGAGAYRPILPVRARPARVLAGVPRHQRPRARTVDLRRRTPAVEEATRPVAGADRGRGRATAGRSLGADRRSARRDPPVRARALRAVRAPHARMSRSAAEIDDPILLCARIGWAPGAPARR